MQEGFFKYPPFIMANSVSADDIENLRTYFVVKKSKLNEVDFLIEEVHLKNIKSTWYQVSELNEAFIKDHKRENYPGAVLIIEKKISNASSLTLVYYDEHSPDLKVNSYAGELTFSETNFNNAGELISYKECEYQGLY